MNIDEEYPQAIQGEFPSCVRLLTAVHLACVDAGGNAFGLTFHDDELQDFFDTNKHGYFSVKPRGDLKKAAELLSKAICNSIESKELKLVVTRKNLGSGEICLLNSWVSCDEFDNWCESRKILLNEEWMDFLMDENRIASCASEELDTRRRSYEGLLDHFNDELKTAKKNLEEDGFEYLLNEVATLRSKLNAREARNAAIEKPLSLKERNTLLTIIAALCKEAKLDHTKPAKTAGLIQSTALSMGLSIGETTIEGHLKKIPRALESRMK